jgi:TolB-like protein/Flp pilus assembly protein TadD
MSAANDACLTLSTRVELSDSVAPPRNFNNHSEAQVSFHKAGPSNEQIVDIEDRPSPRPADDRLDSWKEIANYLNRDVRTVRRWEKDQGLPVRRHQHQKGASVFAYKSEINTWRQSERERIAETPLHDSSSFVSDATRDHRNSWYVLGVIGLFGLITISLLSYFRWRDSQIATQTPPSKLMLAVLPFQNLTGDPAQDYIGDGLTEEMITQASGLQHERLGVIARTSSMAYKDTKKPVSEIGQELGVDYVLEGSVRRSGDRMRITAQLIQVRDQTHVWAQDYDTEKSDVLKLQSETAQAIAQQLHLHLLALQGIALAANKHDVNLQAHELYMQGRHFLDQRSRDTLPKSIDAFKQAAEKDPGYAAAYAGLADAYNLTAFYGLDPSLNSVTRAKIAADKAIELDDSLAAGHAAEGYTQFMWQGNWNAAEKEFRRALELDDNYVPAHQWYGLYLAARGRTDEAAHQMTFAEKLDPLSPSAYSGLAYIHYLGRNYDLANESAHTALQLNPNSIPGHVVLGWSYTQQKNYSEAIKELQTAADLSGNVPVYLAALARAYALSGNRDKAAAILDVAQKDKTQQEGAGTALASAYLAVGDQERALYWLGLTAAGDIQANWLRVDPAFDSLRQNPRFIAVVDRIGTEKN